MKKTFENYDKLTAGEKVAGKLKFAGWAILGALVGALPYFVLLQFGISSVFLYVLCGMGAMTFYAAFGKGNGKSFIDRTIVLISNLIGTFIAFCTTYITHYAPMWTLDGREDLSNVEKLFFELGHAHVDRIENGRLITDGGSFSFWTVLIAAGIFAVIGMYVALIFVLVSSRDDKKKGKK